MTPEVVRDSVRRAVVECRFDIADMEAVRFVAYRDFDTSVRPIRVRATALRSIEDPEPWAQIAAFGSEWVNISGPYALDDSRQLLLVEWSTYEPHAHVRTAPLVNCAGTFPDNRVTVLEGE